MQPGAERSRPNIPESRAREECQATLRFEPPAYASMAAYMLQQQMELNRVRETARERERDMERERERDRERWREREREIERDKMALEMLRRFGQ